MKSSTSRDTEVELDSLTERLGFDDDDTNGHINYQTALILLSTNTMGHS